MLFHRSRAFDAKIHSNPLAFQSPLNFRGKTILQKFISTVGKGVWPCKSAAILPRETFWNSLLPDLNIALWPYLIGF
jgi:hypothetical protein